MVSGIGPSETLKKYNIDVVSDLPGVGQGERVSGLGIVFNKRSQQI